MTIQSKTIAVLATVLVLSTAHVSAANAGSFFSWGGWWTSFASDGGLGTTRRR